MKFLLLFATVLTLICACRPKTTHISKEPAVTPNTQNSSKLSIPQDINYDTIKWMEFTDDMVGIILDLRYATRNNFTGVELYECGRCFVARKTGQVLLEILSELYAKQLKIVFFDCYRPLDVQKRLWALVPNPNYVADPIKGSTHNRGISVDMTLADSTGTYLNMGTEYDHFGPEAHHDYKSHDPEVIANRLFLKQLILSSRLLKK